MPFFHLGGDKLQEEERVAIKVNQGKSRSLDLNDLEVTESVKSRIGGLPEFRHEDNLV